MKWLVMVRNVTAKVHNNETWLKLVDDSFYSIGNSDQIQTRCYWKDLKKNWDTFEIVDYILTGPLLLVLIIVGLVSGMLCLVTFLASYKKLKIYVYLITLAIWDMAYLTTSFYLYGLPTLIYQEIVVFGPLMPLLPTIYYLGAVTRIGCLWTVVLIAFERFLALCYPFKFQAWSNSHRRLLAVFSTLALAAFIYCLPRYFETYVNYCLEITQLQKVAKLGVSRLRNSTHYWLLYRVIGGLMLYSAGPFITLVVLTAKISFEIRRSDVDSRKLRSSFKRTDRAATSEPCADLPLLLRPSLSQDSKTSTPDELKPETRQRVGSSTVRFLQPDLSGQLCPLLNFSTSEGNQANNDTEMITKLQRNCNSQIKEVDDRRKENSSTSTCHQDLLHLPHESHYDGGTRYTSKAPMSCTSSMTSNRGSLLLRFLSREFSWRRGSLFSLRSNANGQQGDDKRLNNSMHLAMICKFLLCHSFPVFMDFFELFHPSVSKDSHKMWVMMTHVSVFLVTLNSSCNFFIYLTTSERFRSDVRRSLNAYTAKRTNVDKFNGI